MTRYLIFSFIFTISIGLIAIEKTEGAILFKDKNGNVLPKAPHRYEKSPASIEFLDKNGNLTKKITTDQKSQVHNGKNMEGTSYLLSNKTRQRILLTKSTRDVTEKNPYLIRYSSSNHIEYYDDTGSLIFEMDTFYQPVKVSENGEIIVGLSDGFALLEGFNIKPAQQEDPKLIHGLLSIISKNGKIIYEKELPGPSPTAVEVSPLGKWVACAIGNVFIIDAQAGKEIAIDPENEKAEINIATFKGIDDSGNLLYRKFIKQDKDGKRIFKKYSYSPSQRVLTVLGEESEN